MTIFVDASALVAILQDEPEAQSLSAVLDRHKPRFTSAIAMWETARAIAKADKRDLADAWQICERFRLEVDISIIPIGEVEAAEAVRAHARYGKGTAHPPRLNMGDCFAYACAKTNGAKLLYKGDDFIHTDLK